MKYLLLISTSLLAPLTALAQAKATTDGYQLLEPLPGLSSGAGVSFTQLLSVFFTLALSLSAAAAVVMITLGGVQYMFSDVPGVKSLGRERIRNAVFGLILVFGSWLIISTINPDLLLFRLNIPNRGTTYGNCTYLICKTTNVDRTIRDANDANKKVQEKTYVPGSFKPSMELPNQRIGTDGLPSSEAGKNYVRDCLAIGGTPMRQAEPRSVGTFVLSCQR